jgi:epidermal growth factor receptor substrate 15
MLTDWDQIWQIADTENRGLLTPSGFGVVLRLIGHAQAGRPPSAELATQGNIPAQALPTSIIDLLRTAGPLPRFDGQPIPPVATQTTGPPASPTQAGPPPIRVPPLAPEKINEYSLLFEKSGAENGLLSGVVAKQIFEKARLPNEVLGRVWNLSDTQARGALDTTEFVIAMHLLASYKAGVMRGVPNTLPPGLYEAASRRPPIRTSTGSRPTSNIPPVSAISPQFSGYSSGRPQSPNARQQVAAPLSSQSTGEGWLISPTDKSRFDQVFATLDRSNRGFITGEQAVTFFSNARLPEEVLAQIWDLADINSEGKLNRDEFAVAMYLIRQQRGSKDGRGILPPTLPPALVPPSMRRQQVPPSHPTAPAFENAPVTQPRSAADDLFGLDAFSSPAPTQAPQSTGSSVGGPFQTSRSPAPPAAVSSQVASTSFKPFVPSSSFGQSLAPQATGVTGAQSKSIAPQTQVSDDLLGDADPEISRKLTSDTTELANLSNQVGNLSKQMTEVHGDRTKAEQELAQSAQQKRDFETRLTQLRAAYEQEVKDVKVLQERLVASRSETKRLQQDMAMIDGSHQDLRTQHQQISSALEADQRENASLKEKIRNLNAEVNQLKPQLEKLKSDARQQKGIVAINRKQLATNEAERDRLLAEKAAAAKELEDATNEAQQTAKEAEQARSIPQSSVTSPVPIASPTPSTSSNPFFRRTTAGPSEPAFSPSTTDREPLTDNRNTFDSIFGPSFQISSSATPPPVSFRSETPVQPREAPVEESHIFPYPSSSPPTSSSGLPEVSEPPAPPQSGQITSAALPFRAPLSRDGSISSSVRVAPPASRLSPAGTPGVATPDASTRSTPSQPEVREATGTSEANGPGTHTETSRFEQASPSTSENQHDSLSSPFGPATNQRLADIPGAFPGADTPESATPQLEVHPTAVAAGAGGATLAASAGLTAAVTHEHDKHEERQEEPKAEADSESNNRNSNFDDFFGGPARPRSDSEKAADFDSAFSTMKKAPITNGDTNTSSNEFPPIQELEPGDESDDSSETPMAFDDNFNTTSPPRPLKVAETESSRDAEPTSVASAVPGYLQSQRPALGSTPSAGSSLPGIEAQTSPPGYDESVLRDDPSHFPPEFKGLLSRREDPTSPPTAGSTTAPEAAASHVQSGYGPEHDNQQILREQGPPIPPQKHFTSDDFDFAFADMNMSAAPVEDDEDDDTFDAFRPSHNTTTDFDPTFDSPRQPKSTNATIPPLSSMYSSVTNGQASQTDSNHAGTPAPNRNFSFDRELPVANTNPTTSAPSAPPPVNISHDWDAMFEGLDTPAPDAEDDFGPPPPPLAATSPTAVSSKATAASAPPPPASRSPQPERPVLGRALTQGTEHDDPILKRLTAMGWSREESLAALEKFDYNIDKVRSQSSKKLFKPLTSICYRPQIT